MNPRTRIDHDGSRDVDVQSLFYDRIDLVRRIARMGNETGFIAETLRDSEVFKLKQRIAELKAERGRLRFLLRSIYNDLPTRRDWLDPSLERSIRDELENRS